MTTRAPFRLRTYNPDVLACIANLSNDEVFTPPDLANQMLNTLERAWAEDHDGASIWKNPEVRFLDPCTKSGIFLREITRRLVHGLADQIPDLQERVDHILTKQVFGIAITELTALLARRSVYCSKHAKGQHSVAKSFTTDDGNIWFERTYHDWDGGRCRACGASRAKLDREEALETYAYPFIHADNIKTKLADIFGADMQFDVVIGNPPYQLEDGGYGASASPIYHLFVEAALGLDPRYAVFITPSRWMVGGKGLDQYRKRMLADRRLRRIVDFPKLYEAFPGVKIRGGVSYFLWARDYDGPCEIETIIDGKPAGPAVARDLNEFDVLVRRNEAVPILRKVRAKGEPTLDKKVSSRKPFGLPTNFRGQASPEGMSDPVRLFENQRETWIDRSSIPSNQNLIEKWKVLMTRVQGTSSSIERRFLSKPTLAPPGSACTETYLIAGSFHEESEALNLASYLRTRFVRFLVSLRKVTQDATRDVYAFVPDLPLDEEWTDEKLYRRYGLTEEEIAFIESQVVAFDDSAGEEPDGGAHDTDD